jgi:hypothetical protein
VAGDLRVHDGGQLAAWPCADDRPVPGVHAGHLVIFSVMCFRYLDAKTENWLDSGIDPAWLQKPKEQPASVEASGRLHLRHGELDLWRDAGEYHRAVVVAAVVVVWVAVGVGVSSLLHPLMAGIKSSAGRIAT